MYREDKNLLKGRKMREKDGLRREVWV